MENALSDKISTSTVMTFIHLKHTLFGCGMHLEMGCCWELWLHLIQSRRNPFLST